MMCRPVGSFRSNWHNHTYKGGFLPGCNRGGWASATNEFLGWKIKPEVVNGVVFAILPKNQCEAHGTVDHHHFMLDHICTYAER